MYTDGRKNIHLSPQFKICSSRLKEQIYKRGPESSGILCILFVGLPIPHFKPYEITDLEFIKE